MLSKGKNSCLVSVCLDDFVFHFSGYMRLHPNPDPMGLKGDFDGVLHPGALLQPIEEDHPGPVHSVLHLGLVGTPTDQLLDLILILPGLPQVWQLAQFYSVDLSKSRIGGKKCVFNKRTVKVCISCF